MEIDRTGIRKWNELNKEGGDYTQKEERKLFSPLFIPKGWLITFFLPPWGSRYNSRSCSKQLASGWPFELTGVRIEGDSTCTVQGAFQDPPRKPWYDSSL